MLQKFLNFFMKLTNIVLYNRAKFGAKIPNGLFFMTMVTTQASSMFLPVRSDLANKTL